MALWFRRWLVLLVSVFPAYGLLLLNDHAYDARELLQRFAAWPGFDFLFRPNLYNQVSGQLSFRPLTVAMLYLVDYKLLGGVAWPVHALAVLLHSAAACALYHGVRALGASPLASWIAAFFFLLHPIQSSVVACAGFRGDLVVTWMAAMSLQWVGVASQRRSRIAVWWWAPIVLLAAGFKENGVLIGVLVPATLWLGRRRLGTERSVVRAIGVGSLFVVGAMVLFAWGWWAFRWSGGGVSVRRLGSGSLFSGLVNFAVAAKEIYAARLVWPWPLRIIETFQPVAVEDVGRWAGAVALWGVCVAGLLFAAFKNRLVAVGTVWVVIGLAPVAQIVPIPDPLAERFLYFPMLGLSLLVAAAVESRRIRVAPRRIAAAAGAWFFVFALLDARRCLDWRDSYTIQIANWTQWDDHRVEAMEEVAALWMLRSDVSVARRDLVEAASDLSKARLAVDALVGKHPNAAVGHRFSAVLQLRDGDTSGALESAMRAVRLAPNDASASATLAVVRDALLRGSK